MKNEPVVYHSPTVWTGFYVGGHIGGAWGHSDFSKGKDGGPPLDVSSDPEGVFGGAQLGFDVQKGQFVYGIVGDLSASNIDGEGSQDGPPTAFETEYDWLATVRARAGVLAKPDLLLYVHGGLAVADISFDSTIGDGPRKNVSNDETQTGWVAGAGAEYALAPGTFIFAEYSYMDFGEQSATSSETPQNVDQDSDLHTVKVGVNFKIGHRHMASLK